jgi:integrative and conjugative element protein (TIGR02256 family)
VYPSPFGTIIFRGVVIETFSNFSQRDRWKPEAGGQLFASMKNDKIDVVYATGPSKNAARGRFFFHPNRKEEQLEIKSAFEKELHFIGDWHTHPELEPNPSAADVDKAVKIFKRSQHELNGLLMVIVGSASFPRGLWCAWVTKGGISVIERPL